MIETNVNLEINELTQNQFESAKETGNINPNALYMTTDDFSSDVLSIKSGGTDANNVKDARTNLGFTYGTAIPEVVPTTGEGSIYFKLSSDGGDEIPLTLTINEYQELITLIDSI